MKYTHEDGSEIEITTSDVSNNYIVIKNHKFLLKFVISLDFNFIISETAAEHLNKDDIEGMLNRDTSKSYMYECIKCGSSIALDGNEVTESEISERQVIETCAEVQMRGLLK